MDIIAFIAIYSLNNRCLGIGKSDLKARLRELRLDKSATNFSCAKVK